MVLRVVVNRRVVGSAAANRTPCRRASPDNGCLFTVGMLSPSWLAQIPDLVNPDVFQWCLANR
eukprot:978929-Pyramimonas_sp.AAC.1